MPMAKDYDSDVEIKEGSAVLRHGGKWTSDTEVKLPKEEWPGMNNAEKIDYILNKVIQEGNYTDIDVRFTMPDGQWHSFKFSAKEIDNKFFTQGFAIDGSSFLGGNDINKSDIKVKPALSSTGETIFNNHFIDKKDPITAQEQKELILIGNIYDGDNRWEKDPRYITDKALDALASVGGTTAYIGPEPENFIERGKGQEKVKTHEQVVGHRAGKLINKKSGYAAIEPKSQLTQHIRSINHCLELLGIPVERGSHEVAANQIEVNFEYANIKQIGDRIQKFIWAVEMVADKLGDTASFEPKPFLDDNGNGMHLHFSIFDQRENLFAGSWYAGLSDTAKYAMGGILKHAEVLAAFTNPHEQSYDRLKPGFEAPRDVTYAAANRSAAIRIPKPTDSSDPRQMRFENRFPDPAANIYLATSALVMAAIDGIKNKVDPGKAAEYDLHSRDGLERKKQEGIRELPASLEEAHAALADSEKSKFLTLNNVFTQSSIDAQLTVLSDRIDKRNQKISKDKKGKSCIIA